ncbi:hypothetical protein [Streptomyces sp. NPDC001750]
MSEYPDARGDPTAQITERPGAGLLGRPDLWQGNAGCHDNSPVA